MTLAYSSERASFFVLGLVTRFSSRAVMYVSMKSQRSAQAYSPGFIDRSLGL